MKTRPDPSASAGQYLSDLAVEGMYYASTVRSPVHRGTLIAIESPALPQGYSLVRGQDIRGRTTITVQNSQIPILATEKLRYRGEAVALVAGPDATTCDELAARVTVRCEEEPPLFAWETFASSQVLAKRVVTIGDPDGAFAEAERVVSGSYKNGSAEHSYSEPMGALAFYDYDKMAVYCASQWPFQVRDAVASVLGCARDDVVIHPTRLGVHLDGKLWFPSLVASHAALVSTFTGHAVKILYTRHEDFQNTPKRARSSVAIDSALDSSGALSALSVHLSINVGAYAPLAEELLSQTMLAATGIYRCANVRIEGYAVATNTVPLGALGGMGHSQAFFAIETHCDRIAKSLGRNPVEWKLENMVGKGSSHLGSETLDEAVPCSFLAARLAAASDFPRKYAAFETVRQKGIDHSGMPLRGVGFALAYQNGSFFMRDQSSSLYTMEATLDSKLVLELRTSGAIAGPDLVEFWAREAASILELDLHKVRFTNPSTDRVPNLGALTMSRIAIVQRLVLRCCRQIQKRRFREPLPITVHCQQRLTPGLRWSPGQLHGSPFDKSPWGGAVVEVEIDPFSFVTKPVGVWLAVDAWSGNAHKGYETQRALESSLRSGAVDALSACMREFLDPTDLGSEAYAHYAQITMTEIPRIHIDIAETRRKSTPRSFEELPFDTIPAAFLSAVSQAVCSELGTLPVRDEDLAAIMGSQ